MHWRKFAVARFYCLAAMLLLAGCQALSGNDSVATIGADLTMYAMESGAIRAAATAEQSMARETIVAASTRVAELSAVNAALGATLRANHTSTPELRAVVVSAEDMGSSLEDDMMDDAAPSDETEVELRVSNISTAAGTELSSGCSTGAVTQFRSTAELIYVTAEVTALRAGTTFSVDWFYEEELLIDMSWQADRTEPLLCIWFYATPEDFQFAPGDYSARLYANGLEVGSASFAILDN